MRRVFIGIKIGDALRNQVYDWQRAHFNLPVRFLARKNLHLTLIPPWQIYEEELPALKIKLCDFRGNLEPFEISFSQISLGPDSSEPGLIWATGEAAPPQIRLKNLVENKISLLNNLHPFKSHLTIARFKPGIIRPKIDEPIDWKETVEAITLYESIPDLTGSEYEILEEIAF